MEIRDYNSLFNLTELYDVQVDVYTEAVESLNSVWAIKQQKQKEYKQKKQNSDIESKESAAAVSGGVRIYFL